MTEATSQTATHAAISRTPCPALVLGVAGLIPFVSCAVFLWAGDGPNQFDTAHALVAYGAVILSFLGGINWGVAIKEQESTDLLPRLVWSVVPSLIAWLALLLQALVNHGVALGLLLLSFVMQYFLDRRSSQRGWLPTWFARLRLILTTGAVLSIAAGLVRVLAG